MSANVDKSLDTIIGERKTNRKHLAGRRNRKAGSKATIAPVGGVKKPTKQKPVTKAVPTGPSGAARSSKIVVSGLPTDVDQIQIKEYFSKSVGPVKRVEIRYNQNGTSRGIADISFFKAESATKAAKELNGMLVDKRPMKIEVVMDASNVAEAAAPKSLSERVAANPRAQPKSATATKATTNGTAKTGRASRASKSKKGRKPKTTAELDAEMTDYWGTNTNGAPAAAAAADGMATGSTEVAANGEDLGMDEISVGSIEFIT